MARWIEYLSQRSDGYLSRHDGFGDWLNVDAETPKDVIATAYFAHSASLMARIAHAIGREEDARKYGKLTANVKKAFAEAYVTEEGKVRGDTQTAYLMALKFDLMPKSLQRAAAEHLIERIGQRNWHLSCGFLGVHLLLPTLSDVGRTDVAYRLLQNTTYPSWGYSIVNGATTIWERWNSYTKQHGFGDVSMNSFNHYAFGSAGEWMFSAIAGIDTDGPGFRRIVIRPRPGGGLAHTKASYRSINGPIAVHWRLADGRLLLDVSIPANTTATVHVPTPDPDAVREGDLPAYRAEGVKLLRREAAAAVYLVGSGEYHFSAPTMPTPE
jgi:alpha-L-rhamnosidase